jgi:AcrR family transcriptional regulator
LPLPPPPATRVRVRRAGAPGPLGGGVYLSQTHRSRLLDAAVAVLVEDGFEGFTARTVSARAGMSSRTFYDLFSGREDCALAAFDRGAMDLAAVVVPAFESHDDWVERVRAGLTALLGELDRDRVRARFVFVVALGAGPGVIERRAAVLEVLARVIDEGRRGEGRAARAGELPALTAEGVVGSVVGVIYARLLREDPEPLSELVGPLMASIVLPYLGREAAARELARPVAVARERGEVCDARC